MDDNQTKQYNDYSICILVRYNFNRFRIIKINFFICFSIFEHNRK